MNVMKSLYQTPLIKITLLLCALLPCAQAADNDRFLIQDQAGFITSLPDVTAVTVTQHLKELQQELKGKLTTLKADVERKRFKAFDTLVTVVMPGGLLYAKLRHDSYKRSERKMSRINEDLARVSGELTALQADNGEMLIATAD
jgi:hypothetical protein